VSQAALPRGRGLFFTIAQFRLETRREAEIMSHYFSKLHKSIYTFSK